MIRRGFLGGMLAMTIPGAGGQQERPFNAPAGQATPVGVQAGVSVPAGVPQILSSPTTKFTLGSNTAFATGRFTPNWHIPANSPVGAMFIIQAQGLYNMGTTAQALFVQPFDVLSAAGGLTPPQGSGVFANGFLGFFYVTCTVTIEAAGTSGSMNVTTVGQFGGQATQGGSFLASSDAVAVNTTVRQVATLAMAWGGTTAGQAFTAYGGTFTRVRPLAF